jgi:P4 family phage/plasmid primase-like protien
MTFGENNVEAMLLWIPGEQDNARNIYYHVNQPAHHLKKKASKADIGVLMGLHADLDLQGGRDPEEEARLLAAIRAVDPPPTVVTFTGGGFQALWKFSKALKATPECVARVEAANKRVAQLLHADNCHDVSRLLRLPYTTNYPNAKKRAKGRVPTLAEIVEADWSRTYDPDALIDALGSLASSDDPEAETATPIEELPGWLQSAIETGETDHSGGDRSKAVFAVAKGLVRYGWDDAAIAALLLNQKYRISEHVLAQAKPAEYARRQARRARDAVAQAEGGCEVDQYTDQWLGLKFVEMHADAVRYTANWGQYHLWDGNLWRRDEKLRAFSMAQLMCREVARAVKGKEVKSVRKNLLSSIARAKALEMARENPALASRPEDWDRDPWLLGTPSGTVDLRTGSLKPSDPMDMITKSTAVAPQGECPLWLDTLDQIFLDDEEVIGFVKRLAGYSLTGLTREEVLAFFWGTGRNGKGTVVETLLHVMGDYGTTVPMMTLVQRRNQEHPTEIAKLHGKRLAVAAETEEGARWNTARIKALTGGDMLTGRFMRNDFFDFVPTFQLIVSSNDKPSFGKVDEAIAGRLVIVPFLATFIKEDADTTRKARLKEEGAGILQWMIDGCVEWQREGLAVPDKLRQATEDYLAGADDIAVFVDDCCVLDLAAKVSSRELYGAFCTWCTDHGIQLIPKITFTNRMIALNRFRADKGKGNEMYFFGVRKAQEHDVF